jgi:hypothetical protein
MKKQRTYRIEQLKFDTEAKVYRKVVFEISMKDAVRAFNQAEKDGDDTKRIEACAVLNLVRQQANLLEPAC